MRHTLSEWANLASVQHRRVAACRVDNDEILVQVIRRNANE